MISHLFPFMSKDNIFEKDVLQKKQRRTENGSLAPKESQIVSLSIHSYSFFQFEQFLLVFREGKHAWWLKHPHFDTYIKPCTGIFRIFPVSTARTSSLTVFSPIKTWAAPLADADQPGRPNTSGLLEHTRSAMPRKHQLWKESINIARW